MLMVSTGITTREPGNRRFKIGQFDFKILKFPVQFAFTMTINKSRGSRLSVCGINPENQFSHVANKLYMSPVPACRKPIHVIFFSYAAENKINIVVFQKVLYNKHCVF